MSEPALVTFRVLRRGAGRRVGGRCVKRTAWNASRSRCDLATKGEILRAAKAGGNDFTMRSRIGGRYLRPGTYRLVATAIDAAGNRSVARRAAFRIAGR